MTLVLLEIDTLALAALTCGAYPFWWKTPKDVGRPHHVHWKATASPSPTSMSWITFLNMLWLNLQHYTSHEYMYRGERGQRTVRRNRNDPQSLADIYVISRRAIHSRRAPSLGGYGLRYRTPHWMSQWDGVCRTSLHSPEFCFWPTRSRYCGVQLPLQWNVHQHLFLLFVGMHLPSLRVIISKVCRSLFQPPAFWHISLHVYLFFWTYDHCLLW